MPGPYVEPFEKMLEEPLIEMLISGELKEGDKIVVRMVNGKISMKILKKVDDYE